MCDHSGPPLPETRRNFFQWFVAGVGAVAALLAGLPLVGFVFGALRKPPTHWVPLGPVSKFPEKKTSLEIFDNPIREPWDGMAAKIGVYVRYLGKVENEEKVPVDKFLVLAMNCAHLGCPVSWFPQSGLFMCPCHGGVYYENGERASGPPPRGMFHCEWRVENGRLEVRAPHLPTLQNTLVKSEKA